VVTILDDIATLQFGTLYGPVLGVPILGDPANTSVFPKNTDACIGYLWVDPSNNYLPSFSSGGATYVSGYTSTAISVGANPSANSGSDQYNYLQFSGMRMQTAANWPGWVSAIYGEYFHTGQIIWNTLEGQTGIAAIPFVGWRNCADGYLGYPSFDIRGATPTTGWIVNPQFADVYTNAYIFQSSTGPGTTGATEPVWTGATVTDGYVTWALYGASACFTPFGALLDNWGKPKHSYCGTVTVTGSGSGSVSASVTFAGTFDSAYCGTPNIQANATYVVTATCSGTTGSPAAGSTTAIVGSKATTGFVITTAVNPGSGNSVSFDWTLQRP